MIIYYGYLDSEARAVLFGHNGGVSGCYGRYHTVVIDGGYFGRLARPPGLSRYRTYDKGIGLAYGEGKFVLVNEYLMGYLLALVAVAGRQKSQHGERENENIYY